MEAAMTGLWAGPMPVDEFLKEFLDVGPEKLQKQPSIDNDHFDSISSDSRTKDMCKQFIELIHSSGTLPAFQLVGTQNRIKSSFGKGTRGQLSVYKKGSDVDKDLTTISYEELELLIELKPKNRASDPFQDPQAVEGVDLDKDYCFEPDDDEQRRCRAQLAYYAKKWFAFQHRTYCFIVWMGDPYARIIRLDHAGAVVTRKFNYRKDGHLLLGFLWRFSMASSSTQGRDATVGPARGRTCYGKKGTRQMATQGLERRHEMQIPDGESWREVLVWGYLVDPEYVTGRSIRHYPAWDLISNEVVFVKDSWRSLAKDAAKETDTLRKLNEANVRNIPIFLCGDDLPGQQTETQNHASKTWNRGGRLNNFTARIHICFASKFMGHHLKASKSFKHLVQVFSDAFSAQQDAYEVCGLLHRDITLGVISLNPGGGGILNDWDLVRTVQDIRLDPGQSFRSGTWQFMPVDLLREPKKKPELQDDLEAFFWVLLYVSIRFLDISLSQEHKIADVIKLVFDQAGQISCRVFGGSWKDMVISERVLISGHFFNVTDNAPLTTLIDSIFEMIDT